MPKVSILLTSYNHEKYIAESIQSILNQTYKDFELVILDDASTDNSVKIIKSFKDERIKPIFRKKNVARAICKEVIEPLKGEYFALAHSDDVWEKDKLEKQVKYLDEHKNTAACFTWVKLIDDDGNKIDDKTAYMNFNVKNRSREQWLNTFFNEGNYFCHPSCLIRKKVQIKEDLYTYGIGSLPDFYRWVKLLLKYDVYVVPKELTCFRIRNNGKNFSGRNRANVIRNEFDVYKVLDLYRSIDSKEFLKVFPTAKKYVVNKEFIKEYALARLCIEKENNHSNAYKFYGLNLIYDLLQDENKRKRLEKLYNYNHRDFTKETGQYDVFNVIPKEYFMDCSIFYSNDNSFSESKKKESLVSVSNNGDFYAEFSDFPSDITKVRIDLDENIYRAYRNLKIIINGKEEKFKIKKSYKNKNELIVLTIDPQIIINVKEKIDKIEIKGVTRVVPNIDIERIFFKKISAVLYHKIMSKIRK